MSALIASKRALIWSLLAAAFLFITPLAHASDLTPFNAKAFAADQSAGKTSILQFHATWCPTCRAQKPVLEELLKEPEFSNVSAYVVDYDNADDLKKKLSVRRQSTVIVYKGETEAGRSVGETTKEALEATLKKGL